jgi:hypothetical protein
MGAERTTVAWTYDPGPSLEEDLPALKEGSHVLGKRRKYGPKAGWPVIGRQIPHKGLAAGEKNGQRVGRMAWGWYNFA